MSDPIKAAADKLEEWAGDLILSRGLADAAEAEKILREHLKPRTCDGCRHWVAPENGIIGDCWNANTYPDEQHRFIAKSGPKFGCVHWEAKEPISPLPSPS